jgi:hypothetical protein
VRFNGDEGDHASAFRRFEQTVAAIEDLADLVIGVECLASFDDVAEARMPSHRASGAGYVPARDQLVINSAVFVTLDAPTQVAVLGHEVGHALRHRRGRSRPGGEDCFEADVLAIGWRLGDALLADRERTYGAEYAGILRNVGTVAHAHLLSTYRQWQMRRNAGIA